MEGLKIPIATLSWPKATLENLGDARKWMPGDPGQEVWACLRDRLAGGRMIEDGPEAIDIRLGIKRFPAHHVRGRIAWIVDRVGGLFSNAYRLIQTNHLHPRPNQDLGGA